MGGQAIGDVKDPVLQRLCLEIFNDTRAEIQRDTNNRLLPMPILPSWDVEGCVREAQRVAEMGLRGVNMCSDPQDLGSPDLANRAWDPLWEVCEDLELPVHFHIGASLTAMNFYGQYFWESQNEYVKSAIGGCMLFIGNARMVINTIFSGLFDRFPKLKMVSVESGIGWVPFILESMNWELPENAPAQAAELKYKPSEYFKRNWYGTLWFENGLGDLQNLVDKVGEDNIMFETDFPHPTCLYPKPLESLTMPWPACAPSPGARSSPRTGSSSTGWPEGPLRRSKNHARPAGDTAGEKGIASGHARRPRPSRRGGGGDSRRRGATRPQTVPVNVYETTGALVGAGAPPGGQPRGRDH